jgi:hypothetical protein
MDAAGGMSADAALVDHIARGKGSSKAAMVELLGRYSKTPALLPAPLARRRRSSPARSSRIHAARKRLRPDSIQQLVADYEAGDSTTILMRTYGLGKGTVLAILEEQGVKMRGQGIPDDRLSEVSDLYSGGLSPNADQQEAGLQRRDGPAGVAPCRRHAPQTARTRAAVSYLTCRRVLEV